MMERTVANSDAMKAVSTIIAGLEVELLSEVKRLEDAAGADHLDEVPTQEERQETLLGLVQAKIGGDGTDFYAEEVMSEHVENPEDAAAYLSSNPRSGRSRSVTGRRRTGRRASARTWPTGR
ncbi:hypothetical protein ACFQL4_02235 [Halosimplex aquaticum]